MVLHATLTSVDFSLLRFLIQNRGCVMGGHFAARHLLRIIRVYQSLRDTAHRVFIPLMYVRNVRREVIRPSLTMCSCCASFAYRGRHSWRLSMTHGGSQSHLCKTHVELHINLARLGMELPPRKCVPIQISENRLAMARDKRNSVF